MEVVSLESAIVGMRASHPDSNNTAKLMSYLKAHKIGNLLLDPDEVLPDSVGFAITERFEMIFQALETTSKCQKLRKNPNVALVVGLDKYQENVRLEGMAEELKGEELEKLKSLYFSFYPDGRLRDRWPGITYFRIRPRWAKYSDFRTNSGPRTVEFNEDDFA